LFLLFLRFVPFIPVSELLDMKRELRAKDREPNAPRAAS
jgi:hypothetical protein